MSSIKIPSVDRMIENVEKGLKKKCKLKLENELIAVSITSEQKICWALMKFSSLE